MASEKNVAELTALFRKLGARDPEGWASSQVNEGIDQLARFVFLREAWKCVVPPKDHGWIDNLLASPGREPELAAETECLARLIDTGIDRDDLHRVVRAMQRDTLFTLLYLLGDPGSLEEDVADLSWRLVRVDDDDQVVGDIGMLHESVLGTDPASRGE